MEQPAAVVTIVMFFSFCFYMSAPCRRLIVREKPQERARTRAAETQLKERTSPTENPRRKDKARPSCQRRHGRAVVGRKLNSSREQQPKPHSTKAAEGNCS
eukprot:1140347-Pelagomonas_calceolata.AAC.1